MIMDENEIVIIIHFLLHWDLCENCTRVLAYQHKTLLNGMK